MARISSACPPSPCSARSVPWFLLLYVIGAVLYLKRPYQRLLPMLRRLNQSAFGQLQAIGWVPIIRVAGDIAKMLGYPVGVRWRIQHKPDSLELARSFCRFCGRLLRHETWFTGHVSHFDRDDGGGFSQPVPAQAENSALCAYWQPNITQWADLITKYSADNGLDPNLVAAVIEEESKGNPRLISRAGAVGLMQIMPYETGFTWRPRTRTLLKPEANLEWGTNTLNEVIRQAQGRLTLAVMAYNSGWDRIQLRSTRLFAAKVFDHYARCIACAAGLDSKQRRTITPSTSSRTAAPGRRTSIASSPTAPSSRSPPSIRNRSPPMHRMPWRFHSSTRITSRGGWMWSRSILRTNGLDPNFVAALIEDPKAIRA